jgi:hypothetical protein
MLAKRIPTMLIRYITSKVDDSGLTLPSIITGILIGMVPFIQLIRQKKIFGWIFLPLAIFSLLMTRQVQNTPGVEVQYYSEVLLGQVMVADVKADRASREGKNLNGRMLFVNRMGQSQVDLTSGATHWNYLIFTSAISSVLPENS